MKHLNTLKGLLLTLLLACTSTVFAHDFEVDGIYYNILSEAEKTVEVTGGVDCDDNYIHIRIPASVTYNNATYKVVSIGKKAFYEYSNLGSVTIPNSVTSIGEKAFFYCDKLDEIEIGKGIERVGYQAFAGCNKVQRIYIEDLAAWCNIEFEDYTSHPAYFENYSTQIYLNNEPLWGIDIPEGVTENKDYVFYNCGISGVRFPSSVKNIGVNVFGFYPDNKVNAKFKSNPSIAYNYLLSKSPRHLIIDDNQKVDFDITNTNTFTDVSYTRTISEGKYETIILPFAPDAASLENYAFYALAESGDGYMRFEEIATPVANTPYIYTLREGKENVAITGGETTISSNIVTPEVDGWQTVGSFSNQTIDTSNGNYYALSATDNEINRITKSLAVLPYRAYFTSANPAKSALNIYISGTTGIKEISSSEIEGFENGVIFDLSGRKITEPTKGNIYIIDGKKTMF